MDAFAAVFLFLPLQQDTTLYLFFMSVSSPYLLILLLLPLLSWSLDTNYDQHLTGKCINIAKGTYEIDYQNICLSCYQGWKLAQIVRREPNFAIIGYDQQIKALFVAFRGSSNRDNWLRDDAHIRLIDYDNCKGCKIHRGFSQAYSKMQGQGLKQAIQKAINEYYPQHLIFTGHSLGGALATIAAIRHKQAHPKAKVSLYTFGQPRVGNANFAEYHSQTIRDSFRVVHDQDIVAHKPALILDYRHGGTQIWYNQAMKTIRGTCQGDSQKCSNSLGNRNYDYAAIDHGSNNYIRLSKVQHEL